MRLDVFLVQNKKIQSRTKAQELIEQGYVFLINDKNEKIQLKKSNFEVTDKLTEKIILEENPLSQYVSRGAYKLEGAVRTVGLNINNLFVLDVGQSTGGFTDYLLQNGARKIVGIDVGSQQLHPKIKNSELVFAFENINVKNLNTHKEFKQHFADEKCDLVVCDVSFISLGKILNDIEPYLKSKGYFLFLVKPQFECGPENLDKNGLVKNTKVYAEIESRITQDCERIFSCTTQYFSSSITGKDGNKEFFIYGQKN